jgi:hypothetical protein
MGGGLRPWGMGEARTLGRWRRPQSSYMYKQFAQPNTGAAFRPI